MKQAKWEGRFERVGDNIILDGAHNSEGTTALIETLRLVAQNKRIKIVYAALQDKDHAVSIQLMDKVASAMYFTQIDLPRAAKAEQLFSQSEHPNKSAHANWKELIEHEVNALAEDELLVITGSLYFIAEVRSEFAKKGWL